MMLTMKNIDLKRQPRKYYKVQENDLEKEYHKEIMEKKKV